MDFSVLESNIISISDENLFKLLEIVSNEVKRRNNMIAPPISDMKNKSVEQNVIDILSCLANLGMSVKK